MFVIHHHHVSRSMTSTVVGEAFLITQKSHSLTACNLLIKCSDLMCLHPGNVGGLAASAQTLNMSHDVHINAAAFLNKSMDIDKDWWLIDPCSKGKQRNN